jgi:thioesterase domain-containing protein
VSVESKPLAVDEKRALLAEILKKKSLEARQTRLSKGEERLWRLLQLEPDSAVYNVGFAYELKGPLDVQSLENALQSLAQRHQALRTGYAVVAGVPKRIISPEPSAQFERVDLSSVSETDFPSESRRRAIAIACSRIELTQPPLWRFTLLERSEYDRVFLINTHHIISDRWSVGVLIQELMAEYTALVRGEPSPLAKLSTSHSEAIARAETSLSELEVEEELAYWRAQFSGEVQDLILPTTLKAAGESSYRGMRRTITLSGELAGKLSALANGENVTLYVVLLAGLAARFYLDTGQTDLVFITPVSGRHHPATRGVIGYFNNLLPIRVAVADGSCFRDLLRSAAQTVKGAFEHQSVPFQKIAEQPGLNRVRLGRCMVSVQNTTSLMLDLPGITSSYYDVPTETANFDLAVFMEEHEGTYRCWVDAKTELWTPDALDEFIQRFLMLLKTVLDRPEQPLEELAEEPRAHGVSRHQQRDRMTTRADHSQRSATGHHALVRNELERQIIGIWEDLIGQRPLGPHSDFFALSGDSLLAARLFDRLGRVVGREIPLAALVRAPTIRQLSELIVSDGDAPCWAALVPLQPQGTTRPLFCVHGGGGGVLSYTRVAEHLGPDQPLWGLQVPRRPQDTVALRVEQMAQQYIEAMYTVSPEGPYSLCGHSFGALVAYEMARELTDRGKQVDLLVIIDHPGPDARISWIDRVRWVWYSLSQLDMRRKKTYILDRVKWRIRKNERLPWVIRRFAANRAGQAKDTKGGADYRIRTLNETMTAMKLYQPGSYPGRVTVFRARGGSPAINTDPLGGWGVVAQGGVEVHDFACDHMELLDEPNCRNLSAVLKHCLERAQNASRAEAPRVGIDDCAGVSR